MIDAGKAYNAANRQFVNGIRELAQQSTKDEVIEVNKQTWSESTALQSGCVSLVMLWGQSFVHLKFNDDIFDKI